MLKEKEEGHLEMHELESIQKITIVKNESSIQMLFNLGSFKLHQGKPNKHTGPKKKKNQRIKVKMQCNV